VIKPTCTHTQTKVAAQAVEIARLGRRQGIRNNKSFESKLECNDDNIDEEKNIRNAVRDAVYSSFSSSVDDIPPNTTKRVVAGAIRELNLFLQHQQTSKAGLPVHMTNTIVDAFVAFASSSPSLLPSSLQKEVAKMDVSGLVAITFASLLAEHPSLTYVV
jgi:hypothetical protein